MARTRKRRSLFGWVLRFLGFGSPAVLVAVFLSYLGIDTSWWYPPSETEKARRIVETVVERTRDPEPPARVLRSDALPEAPRINPDELLPPRPPAAMQPASKEVKKVAAKPRRTDFPDVFPPPDIRR